MDDKQSETPATANGDSMDAAVTYRDPSKPYYVNKVPFS